MSIRLTPDRSTLRGKALLPVIARHAREVHLVVPHQERACSHEILGGILAPIFSGPVSPATVEAIFPSPGRCTLGAVRLGHEVQRIEHVGLKIDVFLGNPTAGHGHRGLHRRTLSRLVVALCFQKGSAKYC